MNDVSTLVLKDRKTLANEGVVTAVIMVNKSTGKPMGDVEIIMRGVSGGDDVGLLDDATLTLRETLRGLNYDSRLDPRALRKDVRDSLSKFLWNRCRRRPMIIPVVMEI